MIQKSLGKTLRNKLRDKDVTIGSWVSMPHPSVIEVMCSAGFDWLTIDMEHTATNLETCFQAIQTIQSKGLDALVRVPQNEEIVIKKVMDSGASGVIVPMIKNAKEARQAVSFVKYPPHGKRGVGLYRAQGYGTSFNEYKKWVHEESVVIAQVEHIDAVNDLENILAVEGIDGIIVGPYDLSASMGKPGEFDAPEVVEALKRVVEVTKKSDKSLGFHVIPSKAEALKEKIDEGYTFLAFSLDFFFLGDRAREEMAKIKG